MNWLSIIFKILLGFGLIVIAFIIGPVLMIWALNTLFPALAIPYTWETWAAAFLLSAPFSAGTFKRNKD